MSHLILYFLTTFMFDFFLCPLMLFTNITVPSTLALHFLSGQPHIPLVPIHIIFPKIQTFIYLLIRNYYFNCSMLKIELLTFLGIPGLLLCSFFDRWHQHIPDCLNQKSSKLPCVLCVYLTHEPVG